MYYHVCVNFFCFLLFGLQHFSIDNYVLKSVVPDKSMQQAFQEGLRKYSNKNFEPSMLESWIQFLEQLLPFFSISIPHNLVQNAEGICQFAIHRNNNIFGIIELSFIRVTLILVFLVLSC